MVKNIKSNFTAKIIGRFILLLSSCAAYSNSVHAPKNDRKTENKMHLSSDEKNKLKNKSECEIRLN